MKIIRHILFEGKVQGVWFRKTSKEFADEIGLNGWVKNLPDGRVEMVVFGHPDQISELTDRLYERFQILSLEERDTKEIEDLNGFEIRY